ncbi:MAG: response regulator transcription factor [Pseudomonadales bacterium]
MRICLLEDDLAQAELVVGWLRDAGYTVDHKPNSREFLQQMKENSYDLAVLDWEVPGMSGVDVLEHLRNALEWNGMVLFTTQRDSEADVARALHAGADDYLVKPLRKEEMLARLIALARRSGTQTMADVIDIGPISLNRKTQEISVAGEAVKLTAKDFQLARYMIEHTGKLVSRDQLLKSIWGINETVNTRTVDVHMSRIRRKLGITPEMGYRIKTIYQYGYRLEKVETEQAEAETD